MPNRPPSQFDRAALSRRQSGINAAPARWASSPQATELNHPPTLEAHAQQDQQCSALEPPLEMRARRLPLRQ